MSVSPWFTPSFLTALFSESVNGTTYHTIDDVGRMYCRCPLTREWGQVRRERQNTLAYCQSLRQTMVHTYMYSVWTIDYIHNDHRMTICQPKKLLLIVERLILVVSRICSLQFNLVELRCAFDSSQTLL